MVDDKVMKNLSESKVRLAEESLSRLDENEFEEDLPGYIG
jgi:hypothetical protein